MYYFSITIIIEFNEDVRNDTDYNYAIFPYATAF